MIDNNLKTSGGGTPGVDPFAVSAAPAALSAAGEISGMYYDALSRDYDQYFREGASGIDTYANIGDLASQRYERDPFAFGDILKGAGAGIGAGAAVGAAFGSVAPGVGTAIGAGVGTLAGLGSAIIKNVRQNRANSSFDDQRREAITGGIQRNAMLQARRDQANYILEQVRNQYKSFY